MFAKRLYMCDMFMSFERDKGKDYTRAICSWDLKVIKEKNLKEIKENIILVRYVHSKYYVFIKQSIKQ